MMLVYRGMLLSKTDFVKLLCSFLCIVGIRGVLYIHGREKRHRHYVFEEVSYLVFEIYLLAPTSHTYLC